MKSKRIIIALAMILCILLSAWLFCRRYPVPPWAAYQARQRISLVHPGMTDTQFWDTLGLSKYKFYKGVMGSGNPHDYPMTCSVVVSQDSLLSLEYYKAATDIEPSIFCREL